MIRKDGITHLIRPGALFTDLSVLLPLRGTYDGFVLNAAVIATGPDRAARFMRKFTPTVPYVVDPKTYAFARKPDRYLRKQSWRRLLGYYGLEQADIPLGADMTDGQVNQLVERTLEFERTGLPDVKQMSLLEPSNSLRPKMLVAPYFLFGGTEDPWFETNLRLIARSVQCRGDLDMYAVLLLPREVLREEHEVSRIAEGYSRQGVAGYFIWLDDTSESALTVREIRGLRRLISALSQDRKYPVLSMFGGYLSAAMYHHGLAGFCHSVGGGEKRTVDPPSGGPTDVLFYMPPLHVMRPAPLVDEYLERIGVESTADYRRLVCGCQICTHHVIEAGLDGFTASFAAPVIDMRKFKPRGDHDSKILAALHYMLVRHREIRQVEEITLREITAQLVQDSATYMDPVQTKAFDTQFLRVWAQGLTSGNSADS